MAPRRRQDYRAYLASPHWQATRNGYWRAKWPLRPRCDCCGAANEPIDLHHNTYATLGRERFEDLTPLCRACHDELHRIARWPGQTLESALKMVKARARRRG